MESPTTTKPEAWAISAPVYVNVARDSVQRTVKYLGR
jgi:hypothetical protein